MKTQRPSRRVLRDDIKDYLISAIVRGHLMPGDRIIETRVAEELGVSQAPVREALRDLEIYGFVKSVPFRGTRVRQLTKSDLIEIFPVRAALESLAAKLAAVLVDNEVIQELEGLIEQMRKSVRANNPHEFNLSDIAFHRAVIEASGNRVLLQVWDSMRLATSTFLTVAVAGQSLAELAERHSPILDALRARDPVRAHDAMRLHIEELGEWIEGLSDEVFATERGRKESLRGQRTAKDSAAPLTDFDK